MQQTLSYLTGFGLVTALIALIVAGYNWMRMQRHLKPELKGRIILRGMIDSINADYYDARGLRYRRRALLAYGVMVVGIVFSISANLVAALKGAA